MANWPTDTQCIYCGTTDLTGGSSPKWSWKPVCLSCNRKGPPRPTATQVKQFEAIYAHMQKAQPN